MANEQLQHAGDAERRLYQAVWHIYNRPQPPTPPHDRADNLPWDDPEFSERMLREHLDQSHGAASRRRVEILRLVDWMWDKLGLQSGSRILDVTCGPGLYAVEFARRGCTVHGIDFSPASIRYARQQAAEAGLAERCTFDQRDVRTMDVPPASFDAALFIYGQLSVFTPQETAELLRRCVAALRPPTASQGGGRMVIELLDFDHIDKTNSNWWYTDNKGLWGDFPFLHLGERHWDDKRDLSYEQFHLLNLETGKLREYTLTDQGYPTPTMTAMLREAGFGQVDTYPNWEGAELYDGPEWVVYVAER
jgi:SAM-dependent methyltransferase